MYGTSGKITGQSATRIFSQKNCVSPAGSHLNSPSRGAAAEVQVSQDSTTDETQLLELAALDSGTEADDPDSPPGTPPSGDTLLLASLDSPVPVGEPEANPRALPQYRRAAAVSFTLGTMAAEETAHVINSAYGEAVHYRPNAFDVPRGSTGEAFVTQLSRYLHVFGNGRTYEDQALKIEMVYQLLLLQKPYQLLQSSYAKCCGKTLHFILVQSCTHCRGQLASSCRDNFKMGERPGSLSLLSPHKEHCLERENYRE